MQFSQISVAWACRVAEGGTFRFYLNHCSHFCPMTHRDWDWAHSSERPWSLSAKYNKRFLGTDFQLHPYQILPRFVSPRKHEVDRSNREDLPDQQKLLQPLLRLHCRLPGTSSFPSEIWCENEMRWYKEEELLVLAQKRHHVKPFQETFPNQSEVRSVRWHPQNVSSRTIIHFLPGLGHHFWSGPATFLFWKSSLLDFMVLKSIQPGWKPFGSKHQRKWRRDVKLLPGWTAWNLINWEHKGPDKTDFELISLQYVKALLRNIGHFIG